MWVRFPELCGASMFRLPTWTYVLLDREAGVHLWFTLHLEYCLFLSLWLGEMAVRILANIFWKVLKDLIFALEDGIIGLALVFKNTW